jgi:hypothetical protein
MGYLAVQPEKVESAAHGIALLSALSIALAKAPLRFVLDKDAQTPRPVALHGLRRECSGKQTISGC